MAALDSVGFSGVELVAMRSWNGFLLLRSTGHFFLASRIGLDHLAEVPYRDFMDAFADTKHQQPGEEDASIEDEEVMMYTGSGQAAPRTASNRSIMKR